MRRTHLLWLKVWILTCEVCVRCAVRCVCVRCAVHSLALVEGVDLDIEGVCVRCV